MLPYILSSPIILLVTYLRAKWKLLSIHILKWKDKYVKFGYNDSILTRVLFGTGSSDFNKLKTCIFSPLYPADELFTFLCKHFASATIPNKNVVLSISPSLIF